jgi:branched-chain amino acid transport system ATP-binding protein
MRNNGEHNPILKVEDLVVSYYKKEILLGASLEVMPGEIVALIGTNGSGKSTLLKTVAGVIRANSGRIIFNGSEITGKQSNELAHCGIGFLMQGSAVFPSLTVAEHLQLAAQVGKNSADGRLELVWNLFPKLKGNRNKRGGLLSGGERQMLALSMLLVQGAKLWLLDEPSGGLAPDAVKVTMDFISKVNVEEGITVLLAEQNLAEAVRIADRAYFLKNGKTWLENEPKAILHNGRLEEIFFR